MDSSPRINSIYDSGIIWDIPFTCTTSSIDITDTFVAKSPDRLDLIDHAPRNLYFLKTWAKRRPEFDDGNIKRLDLNYRTG